MKISDHETQQAWENWQTFAKAVTVVSAIAAATLFLMAWFLT